MTTRSGFCGKCGAPRVDATDAFCPTCGAPYAKGAPVEPVEPTVTPPEEASKMDDESKQSQSSDKEFGWFGRASSQTPVTESKVPADGKEPSYVSGVLLGFEGKATRSEYVGAYAIALSVLFFLLLLGSGSDTAIAVMALIGWSISHWILASATAARMRDAGQSPHWAWLCLVPFAVTILFIVGLIAPSKET